MDNEGWHAACDRIDESLAEMTRILREAGVDMADDNRARRIRSMSEQISELQDQEA